MKLWKLYLSLMLALSLALSMTACGDDDDDDDDDDVPNVCGDAAGEETADDCVNEEVFKDANATPACQCVCELTAGDCAEGETLDAAACKCNPPVDDDDDECSGDPVDAATLVGKSSAIGCALGGHCDSPPTDGMVCTTLPTLLTCADFPAIGFSVTGAGDGELEMIGAALNDECKEPIGAGCDQDMESPTLTIPPADFTGNPCFVVESDELSLTVSGLTITIKDLVISGKVEADGGFTGGIFGGRIDPEPLIAEIGINICEFLPTACDAEGMVPFQFSELDAYDVPGLVIEEVVLP